MPENAENIRNLAEWMGWHADEREGYGFWKDNKGSTHAQTGPGENAWDPYSSNDDLAMLKERCREIGWEWKVECQASVYYASIYIDGPGFASPCQLTENEAFCAALLDAIGAKHE